MIFYVEALTEDGKAALEKEMAERTLEQRIKARMVVKIKIKKLEPLTLSFQPSKAVMFSVKMMGTLGKYREDFEKELCLGIEKNGASKEDYKLWVVGTR